ncbi:hypothetical protein [Roseicyclus mahoneyensis]|uniref:DUF1772 domain-containing protein n=1 Tax=Roseicyclus mahoneyensis TaxID=164332 RepID=A0A316GK67_9RHOB|nr:hypothetical protein [Roseicyclus mahoneyensis]PWK61181.1 hypothetical protein C7455_103383 [Roseicyclus mahoneyensis]
MPILPILASLLLGSVFIAALILGADGALMRLTGGGIDTTFVDTHALATFDLWMTRMAVLSPIAAGLLAVALWLGRPALRQAASMAAIIWALGIAVALYPRSILIPAPLPRRTIDDPAAVDTWALVTTTSEIVFMIASVALLGCAARAVVSRLRPRPD